MKSELTKYIQLIQAFVDEKIPVQDFEKDYLRLVKNENYIFKGDVAKIIETLFSDIDAYCGDSEIADYDPKNPFADIDEEELRKRSKVALSALEKSL